MASGQKDDDEILSDINVTPLVDIMLVLLIIFMVTATFIKEPVIPVELPRAANAQEAMTKTFALVLDAKGKLYVNGKITTEESARERLKKAFKRDPEVQAIVAADGSVKHKYVVRVIDLVRSTGITKFAINVNQEETSQ